MGAAAARHARTVLAHVEQIVAIEVMAAAQALELRRASMGADASQPGRGVADALALVRSVVPPLVADREPGPDMAAALRIVQGGELAALVG